MLCAQSIRPTYGKPAGPPNSPKDDQTTKSSAETLKSTAEVVVVGKLKGRRKTAHPLPNLNRVTQMHRINIYR